MFEADIKVISEEVLGLSTQRSLGPSITNNGGWPAFQSSVTHLAKQNTHASACLLLAAHHMWRFTIMEGMLAQDHLVERLTPFLTDSHVG